MSGESSKRRKSRSYKVDVSYKTDEAAAPQTRTFSVTSTFFDAHTEGEFLKDPEVQVRFDPSNPTNAIIVGGTNDTSLKIPGIICTVLGALGVLFFFVLGKKRQ